MKHNNMIPNQHFRKEWQNYVRTWFNQPARKAARRAARLSKAKRVAPRPLGLLRPIVRCQTVRYNRKVRAGRGFTPSELKAAGISKKAALGIGIAVDHRRRNKSEEGMAINVNRLKLYKSKLVVYPRRSGFKRIKRGESTRAEVAQIAAVASRDIIPISVEVPAPEPRVITEKDRSASAFKTLRRNLRRAQKVGLVSKIAQRKADQAAGKNKKASAAADDME